MITTTKRPDGVLFHKCSGTTAFWDMLDVFEKTINREDFHEFPKTIWHLSESVLDVSMFDFDNVWPFVQKKATESASGRKIAWVVGSHTTKTFIEGLWESHQWNTEWRVFFRLNDAENWLERPADC